MAADETAYEELLTMDQPKVNRMGRRILVITYNVITLYYVQQKETRVSIRHSSSAKHIKLSRLY